LRLSQRLDGTLAAGEIGVSKRVSRHRKDDVTDAIRHHWDARAVTFDSELGHGLHNAEQRQAWLELLARLAGPGPQRVLDVGCGTGFLALMFAELGHTVTGIDLAPRMLEVAGDKARQDNLSIEFRLENADALTDADGTYDLVVARHVIWTLPDPASGVADWLRVLRPGGRLALIEGKWAYNEALARRHAQPVRRTLSAIVDAALSIISSTTGRKRWKLYQRKYRRIEAQLPFSGGPPAEVLVEFLQSHGMHDVTLEPLMSEALWGEVPPFPRYLALGRR
jgi:2-polyprenyl-3-methyl-5-hydroxy-6-metoxy-1,4-benzoquinol methylase